MRRLFSILSLLLASLGLPLHADTTPGPPPAQKILVITGTDTMVDFTRFMTQSTAWYSCAADYDSTGFLAEMKIHNVTVQTTVPPLATLQTYNEVWDMRFSAANCQGTVAACGSDGITAAQQANYLSYIAAGGSLFLMGDNGGYPGRNSPIEAIANAVDSAGAFQTTALTTNNDTQQGAYIDIAAATAAENYQSDYRDLTGTNRWVATQYNGLVSNWGNGYPVLRDNLTGDATAVAFDCGNMNNTYKAGKLVVAFDWQMMGGGGQVAYCGPPTYTGTTTGYNERFWENSVDFLVPGSACQTPTDTSTRTATRTSTQTATATPSRSATATSSQTVNPSPTPTATATPSASATRSLTPSSTSTATVSFSSTATDTRSATATSTVSVTQSDTATVTATRTPTITVSDTNTPGPTATDSSTPTASSTRTSTVTQSFTSTFTPSRTVTPSFTSTATVSDTNTPGPTPTCTVTPSDTPSNTPSLTQSSTRTATPSFSVTESDTVTRSVTPTDTATMTVTLTSVYTSTDTPTFSVTPSVTPTRTSTTSPSVTPSITLTSTETPSSTFSVTRSSTPTLSDSPTMSSTRTATPTYSTTPTQTISFTASPTPIPVPNHVSIALYNSAGELVKLLFNGGAQYQPGTLNVSSDVVAGGAGSLQLSFPGLLYDPSEGGPTSTLTWTADNDSGQLVKSGIYTIKAEITDPFGQVTTLQHSVQVLDVSAQNSLDIYNSAGELVVQLPLPASGTGRFSSLSLPSDSYGAHYDPKTGQANGGLFQISVTDEHGHVSTVLWDGRNAQGIPAASGSYIAELVYQVPGSGRVVESKSFVLLQAGDSGSLAGSYAAPNPAMHGADLVLHYPISMQYSCVARLYTLAGELVGESEDRGRSGQLRFSTGSLASGVYCAKLENLSGGAVAARTTVKVAIVR